MNYGQVYFLGIIGDVHIVASLAVYVRFSSEMSQIEFYFPLNMDSQLAIPYISCVNMSYQKRKSAKYVK